MNSEKTTTYTAEQTEYIVSEYLAGVAVEAIALAQGKSVRSVIAKLSREGVYVAKAKGPGVARTTKAVMVAAIAAHFNADMETMGSLEKASHEALAVLFEGTKIST